MQDEISTIIHSKKSFKKPHENKVSLCSHLFIIHGLMPFSEKIRRTTTICKRKFEINRMLQVMPTLILKDYRKIGCITKQFLKSYGAHYQYSIHDMF